VRFLKKPAKKVHYHLTTGDETQKTINFGSKLSFILSFLFFVSASTAATYIFTAPNCTTTIINVEPCALNAEYQHFTLSWSLSY
jgi:hypothetical protein